MNLFRIALLILCFSISATQSMEERTPKRKRDEEKEQQTDFKRPKISEQYAFEEENDINLGDFAILPNELISSIIELILADNINNWHDICNFDAISLKTTLDTISLISKNFNVIEKEELKRFIKKLKKKRAAHLKKIIKKQYQKFSKKQLDQQLIDLLKKHKKLIFLQWDYQIIKQIKEQAIRLIIAGANINIENSDDFSSLRYAAKTGRVKIVRLLIRRGANINHKSSYYGTPLTAAAEAGHLEIARLLIVRGANLDTIFAGYTALMIAAYKGNLEIVRLLITYGADLNIKNHDGYTALICACKSNNLKLVKLLIKSGAEVNSKAVRFGSPLTWAAENDHTKIVRLLLEYGANTDPKVSYYGNTALMLAAIHGYVDIVELLIQHKVEINTMNNEFMTALAFAKRYDHIEIVTLLIENGAKNWWFFDALDTCSIS